MNTPRRRALPIVVALLCAAAVPARAEMGPCIPDSHDGLRCGSGSGAARVIDGTVSPDKRFAFAWRTETGDTTDEMSSNEDTELVVVRLSDGAVLAKTASQYWDTGEMHVNRLQEQASWSPDTRLVVRAFQDRFDTPNLDLFAFDGKDALAGTVDLRKIIEPAVVKRLRTAVGASAEKYSFAVHGGGKINLGNNGLMRVSIMMWVPKEGPAKYYDVTVQIARGAGKPSARVVAIKPGKEWE